MSQTTTLTQEILKSLLNYDPETGRWSRVKDGRFVGSKHYSRPDDPYVRLDLGQYGQHYSHRLAVLYVTGEWPAKLVDHIDTDGLNNEYGNLRPASHQTNMWNIRVRDSHNTGVIGVRQFRNRWCAEMKMAGKRVLFKTFATFEEAVEARREAERLYHVW